MRSILRIVAPCVAAVASVTAFAPTGYCTNRQPRLVQQQLLPVESCSILDAVEYFDGSEVVDPVVVSSVFWTSLQTKMLSFIIGQVLAVVVFATITSLASQQISKAGDWVSNKVFNSKPKLQVPPSIDSSKFVAQPDYLKLLFCIAIDIIGTSSELVPFVGEVTDLAWAPLAALALRSLYGSNVVFALEFAEEILPFTDILPLATICWVVDVFLPDSDVAKLLQLGRYGSVVNGSSKADAIDVEGRVDSASSRNMLSGDNGSDRRNL